MPTSTAPTPLPLIDPNEAVCCSPGTTAIDVHAAERLAHVFKALGDPARVRLLSLISSTPDREACICDLTDPVGLSQPTVSHHMKILVDAGLVHRDQRGRWAYFTVDATALQAAAQALIGSQPERD